MRADVDIENVEYFAVARSELVAAGIFRDGQYDFFFFSGKPSYLIIVM